VHCGTSRDYLVDLDPSPRSARLEPDLPLDPVILKIFDRRFRTSRNPAVQLLTRAARKARRLAHGILVGG
jgi:chromosome condensin MukBEF ATPase and DNA-binding subunit MukB